MVGARFQALPLTGQGTGRVQPNPNGCRIRTESSLDALRLTWSADTSLDRLPSPCLLVNFPSKCKSPGSHPLCRPFPPRLHPGARAQGAWECSLPVENNTLSQRQRASSGPTGPARSASPGVRPCGAPASAPVGDQLSLTEHSSWDSSAPKQFFNLRMLRLSLCIVKCCAVSCVYHFRVTQTAYSPLPSKPSAPLLATAPLTPAPRQSLTLRCLCSLALPRTLCDWNHTEWDLLRPAPLAQ